MWRWQAKAPISSTEDWTMSCTAKWFKGALSLLPDGQSAALTSAMFLLTSQWEQCLPSCVMGCNLYVNVMFICYMLCHWRSWAHNRQQQGENKSCRFLILKQCCKMAVGKEEGKSHMSYLYFTEISLKIDKEKEREETKLKNKCRELNLNIITIVI